MGIMWRMAQLTAKDHDRFSTRTMDSLSATMSICSMRISIGKLKPWYVLMECISCYKRGKFQTFSICVPCLCFTGLHESSWSKQNNRKRKTSTMVHLLVAFWNLNSDLNKILMMGRMWQGRRKSNHFLVLQIIKAKDFKNYSFHNSLSNHWLSVDRTLFSGVLQYSW